MKGRKGQGMMIGILVMIMAIIIFVATLPAVKETIDTSRGRSYLNCKNYVDRDSSTALGGTDNESYDAALDTDDLGCIATSLITIYLILGVLGAVVLKIIHGKMVEPPAPQYGYPGY